MTCNQPATESTFAEQEEELDPCPSCNQFLKKLPAFFSIDERGFQELGIHQHPL